MLLLILLLRPWLYHLYIKAHISIAVLLAGCLYIHLRPKTPFTRLYLFICLSTLAFTSCVHILFLLRRNVTLKQFGSRAWIYIGDQAKNNTAWIKLSPTRKFHAQAGQFVYIYLPAISYYRSPPFSIAHVEEDGSGFSLMVKTRGHFTKKLQRFSSNYSFTAWIDGPYGKPLDMDEYDHGLMIATGIGIVAQALYIQELLDSLNRRKVQGRSLFVIWQITIKGMAPSLYITVY